MRKPLRYWLQQISCWILLLQMINLSVDPPDACVVFRSGAHAGVMDVLTEKETVYEYVSETLLDIPVPDSDEQDVEKSVHLLELFYSSPHSFALTDLEFSLHHSDHYFARFLSRETIPHAPPPKSIPSLS